MVILGIDPGTATTGYALVTENDDGDPVLLRMGVVQTQASTPMPRRLCTIYGEVSRLISDGRPDALAIEELFFSRNVTTALTVGQARGVVLLAAAQAALPIFEYKPSEVKVALVGYGNAPKRQMQQMLAMILGLDEVPRPDDAADAAAVAICHLQSVRLRALVAAS